MTVPFSRPSITKDEINAVVKVLQSGWLTMGEETQKFEKEFAGYIGAKYTVAVNSCTSALFLSLKALGVTKGDEVIVPSFTFPSTVSVIVQCGATPKFVDISKTGYVMTQETFSKAVSRRTKAVIPVHYGGNRSTIQTNIPIIEDSAHLIPKKSNNNQAFSVCYSFYATKNMTTGEGGMIACNNPKIIAWLKEARLHGLSNDAWKRYKIGYSKIYDVIFPGYKMNTTDINSALGRVQLQRLAGFEKRRKEVVSLYNQLLTLDNRGTHLYPIIVDKRNQFLDYMSQHGIGCSFHFKALHLEPAFKKFKSMPLPITEYISKHVVTLPLDAVITDDEVREVTKIIKEFN